MAYDENRIYSYANVEDADTDRRTGGWQTGWCDDDTILENLDGEGYYWNQEIGEGPASWV